LLDIIVTVRIKIEKIIPFVLSNINVLLVVLREIVRKPGKLDFGASLAGRYYFEVLKSG
tara:strand:+ start:505 stop:681 length:177 start_codon:yes stop_codon:yes gene_type:complete